VTRQEDIVTLAQAIALPLNVMAMPALADFATLAAWGVRRISMGNVVHSALQTTLKDLLSEVQNAQSFSGVFRHAGH
jgi:2-methylisocitrate lyase-like PEP mutase family enzyme